LFQIEENGDLVFDDEYLEEEGPQLDNLLETEDVMPDTGGGALSSLRSLVVGWFKGAAEPEEAPKGRPRVRRAAPDLLLARSHRRRRQDRGDDEYDDSSSGDETDGKTGNFPRSGDGPTHVTRAPPTHPDGKPCKLLKMNYI